MGHDYQSTLVLMNLVLVICAGVTVIGIYRILKVFDIVPWKGANPDKMKYYGDKNGLALDLILKNLPATGTALNSGKNTQNTPVSNLPVTGAAFIPEEDAEDQIFN